MCDNFAGAFAKEPKKNQSSRERISSSLGRLKRAVFEPFEGGTVVVVSAFAGISERVGNYQQD
jgi:hypothetical protein